MSIFELNILDSGSTGKIMLQIAETARKSGFEVYSVSNIGLQKKKQLKLANDPSHVYVNGFLSFAIHYKVGRFFGLNGLLSFFSTWKLIRFMKKKKIDLLHLHNLHKFCFNLPLLFNFVKKYNIPVVWTMHDCWNFTGRCPYFDLTKCYRWKTGCHNCLYPTMSYPETRLDASSIMWKLKKRWFTGIENCTIVTPSQWLADMVKQSYLKDYTVKVINNGIDLSNFKPTDSDFCERYGLFDKKIVLGVAFGWGVRKGLDVFIELAKRLPADYQIVLVGTDGNVDKQLPANIVSIHRTQNQKELAEIYTAADVFANPTREEVLGLVNVESLACGTPVVTFKTGGSPECLDESCGSVVDCDDVDAMEIEIRRICEEKPYSIEACLKRAKLFDMVDRFEEYVNLYKELLK